jgi:sugar-specific transcriptional regulator TrmB
MNITSTLTLLGLDDKEVITYLTCLELGEGPIMPLVQKTGIIRTTLLYVLEKLQQKDLIQTIQHATHRRYLALPPRDLIKLVRRKEMELKEQADSLESSLPELNRLYETDPFQPRIRVYKDEELRTLYNEIIEQPLDELCYVGDTANIAQPIGDRFLQDWIKRRVAKRIPSRTIRIRTGEQDIPEYTGREELLRTIRYAPEGFSSPAVILIYGNNVAIVTTDKESFGVTTTSRDYAESMRSWFEELWKISSEK